MSGNTDKKEAYLLAGQLDGEKLEVEGEFPQGVTVKNTTGDLLFFPEDFLTLLLLRQRGRDG